jgi:ribosomal protein S16
LNEGAKPTETVKTLLSKEKIMEEFHFSKHKKVA